MLLPGIVANAARFSECGLYRYDLTRELGGDFTLVSIGLNPSTADADRDDPTIRKDIGFARRWGMGRVLKLNADAYRATDPDDMRRAALAGVDIVGPDNDRTLLAAVALARAGRAKIVVSWGTNIDPARQLDVANLLGDAEIWCLGTNNDGSPVHELYQPYERELVRWRCPPFVPAPPRRARRARRAPVAVAPSPICSCPRAEDARGGVYPNGACPVHGASHGGGMAGHDDD